VTVDAAIDSKTEESRLAEALEAARQTEIPAAAACLDVARAHLRLGQADEAARWCGRVIETGLDYRSWDAAARLLDRILGSHTLEPKRTARLAVVGSYTTDQLVDLVRLVAASRGIALDIYEAGYGLYQQEILDPNSGLYRHDPEIVLIAVHDGEVRFPAHSPDPEPVVEAETARWVSLWSQLKERTGARIIQTNFARRPENPFGNLASSLPGARSSMLAALNRRLGEEAAGLAALVDCDHLASVHGRAAWFDDRYRHRSKQEVGLGALPLMALNVVAVLAAELGLSRKCLVLDLDGTVWGGVIGEDGMDRIRVGHGIEGEAFADFQRHVLALKDRGVILAVCSKNDEATAREPFESHPDMLIGLGDIAASHAN